MNPPMQPPSPPQSAPAVIQPRRRRWVLAAAAVLLLAVAGGGLLWWRSRPQAPPEVPTDGLDRELAEAIQEVRADVLASPRSSTTWGRFGRLLLANELYPEISLRCFRQAERLEPENPRWPYFAAASLLNLGKRAEAVPDLERAAALCASDPEAPPAPRLLLAESLVVLGREAEAEEHFRHVWDADPNNVRAHFGLGMLTFSRGQWQACRAHLEACLGSPQARKKASAQLAAVWARLGDRQQADRFAGLAARLPKDASWADAFVAEHAYLAKRKRDRYRAVEQLEAEGRLGPAANILADMVRQYPEDYLAHLTLGKVLAQLGQLPLAEKHLHRSLALARDKVQVHYLLGLLLFKKGEVLWLSSRGDRGKAKSLFEDSIRFTRQALALKPDYGYAHMALGLALKYLGRRGEAVEAFRQAVHCNPELADNHFFLGTALADEGKLDEARPYLEEARLLAGPDDPRPRAALEHYFKGKAGPKSGPE